MMNYAFLGLGFVQGWLWLFFLNGPLLFSEAEGWSVDNEIILLCFLLANSLSFLWVAKRTAGSTPLYSRNKLLIASALFMAGGVWIVRFTAGQIGEVPYVLLVLLGSLLAGFGSALLISALGELFSFFSIPVAGLSFAGSVTVGTILFFVALKLPLSLGFLLTEFCPLIALVFIFLGRRQIPLLDLNLLKSPLAAFSFPRRLVLLLILFYLAGGFFYKLILLSSASALQEIYWLTNVIYCLVIIVASSLLFLFSNLDLGLLYRPVLPLLGTGFILILFSSALTVFLPLTLLQAGFALFDLYTWLLFAYMAKFYQRPAFVFGWGMFLITISIFSGETIFATLFANITFSMDEIEILSLWAALLMMVGTLLFQGKRDSFAGWEGPEIIAAEAASTLEVSEPEPEKTVDQDLNYLENELVQLRLEIETSVQESSATEAEWVLPPPLVEVGAIREQFCFSLELTKREKEVALLLFEGRNNPYIRESLNISNNTLKTHLKNIYRKGMVNNRQQLLDLFDEFLIGKKAI